jgi:UDP-N-acetyl-D-mannosaminuronic acid transferase (WecB/TagA/CpsF family)
MERPKRYPILGVGIDAVTMDAAIDIILKHKGGPAYAVKMYAELIDPSRRDPKITKVLNEALLCLPEGVSAQWAGKTAGASYHIQTFENQPVNSGKVWGHRIYLEIT